MIFGTFFWNFQPEIFEIGGLSIRWYGLLFGLAFLVGQFVLGKIFKIEGKSDRDLDAVSFYVMIATIVGARLGHCLFYQPDYYLAHPLEILQPWKGGLASHGATVGILTGLWLYSRKRPDQSFLWIVDRIVIVVAIGGCFIRLGNLMNSEIIGKPANVATSFIFGAKIDEFFINEENKKRLNITKKLLSQQDTIVNNVSHLPVEVSWNFKKPIEGQASELKLYLQQTLSNYLEKDKTSELYEHYRILKPLVFKTTETDTNIVFTTQLYGVPRHPAQLYEAVSCLLLFLFLLGVYNLRRQKTPEGLIFGLFMIILFTLRFFYEFLKEVQVDFEKNIPLNMGQILSIPAILAGFYLLYLAKNNAKKQLTKQ